MAKSQSQKPQSNQMTQNSRPTLKETFGITKGAMTPLKWGVVFTAMIFIGVGAFLHFTSLGKDSVASKPSQNLDSSSTFGQKNNLSPDEVSNIFGNTLTNIFPEAIPPADPDGPDSGPKNSDSESLNEWSPAFLKGGAGLFMGFCVGFAIRSFIKLGSVILGFYVLSLLMLSWLGWIEINYPEIDSQLGDLSENFKGQFESFKTFLSGAIPTTGMAAFGFFAGLKKK